MSSSQQGPSPVLRAGRVPAAVMLLLLPLSGAIVTGATLTGPFSVSGVVVVTLGALVLAAAGAALVAAPGLVPTSSPAAARRGDGLEIGVETHRAQAPGRPGRPMTRAPGAGPLLTA